MSCSRQTDWSVDLFLAAGSSAADRGQGRGQSFETEAEAKLLASRPLWPRGLNISDHKQLLKIFEQTSVNKRKSKQIIYTVWTVGVQMCNLVHVTRGYTGCGEVRCYVNNVDSLAL